MKRFISLFLCFLILTASLLFSSCGEKSSGESVTLYVYNWGEYISDGSDDSVDVNAEFETYCKEELGLDVTVNYSTFSSNEDMYAKISSGSAAYDVIIPSDYMIERMITENLLQPLDLNSIPNYGFIQDKFKGENIYYECNSESLYSIPYMYGMIGVIYNTEIVPEDEENLGSWKLMWDGDYKGDILQYNNSRDASGTAMYSLGYSVNNATDEEWQAGFAYLKAQKEVVQGYVMDEIFNKMKSGSAAVASYYAGDFLTMYEDNDSLAFYYPEEGTNSYVDSMCIPYNAAHADLANIYINFMCRPDIAAANAEYTYYASPLDFEKIAEDEEFSYIVDEYTECMAEVHENAYEILYGEQAQSTKTEPYLNLSPEKLQLLNDLWEDLKIESHIGNGIYVTCGVILAALIVWIIATILRKRRWNKLYD